jgi:hypothetical protein
MEMEKLPFENVDIAKINRELQLKTKFKIGHRDQGKKIKQTSISDFVN